MQIETYSSSQDGWIVKGVPVRKIGFQGMVETAVRSLFAAAKKRSDATSAGSIFYKCCVATMLRKTPIKIE